MYNFYSELAEYLQKNPQLVEERCKTAPVELAWRWDKFKEDPLEFYRTTDLYMFDLSMYQTILQNVGWHNWFEQKLEIFPVKRMLDFGGGIGQYSIIAAKKGVQVDYLELEGSKTLEYAKWRFEKHGVNPNILTEKDFPSTSKYDLIVGMDVLEHIEDPQPVIDQFADQTTYLIANDNIPYNCFYPQHISKPDIQSRFKKVEWDIWLKK